MKKDELRILLLAEEKRVKTNLKKAQLKFTNELCAVSATKAKRCQGDCNSLMLIVQSGRTAQLGKYLKKVEQALERLERGKYGICRVCKQQISDKRLIICPATDICCSCKKSLEILQENHRPFLRNYR